jgi:hypothetical protein
VRFRERTIFLMFAFRFVLGVRKTAGYCAVPLTAISSILTDRRCGFSFLFFPYGYTSYTATVINLIDSSIALMHDVGTLREICKLHYIYFSKLFRI